MNSPDSSTSPLDPLLQPSHMQVALNLISDAVVWTDGDGKIRSGNPALEQLIGCPMIEMLQHPLAAILRLQQNGDLVELADHPVTCCLQQSGEQILGQSGQAGDLPLRYQLAAEPQQTVEIVAADLPDQSGKLFVIRRVAEAQITAPLPEHQTDEAHYKLDLSSTQIGIWDWDLRTNRGNWSPGATAALGLDPHPPELDYQTWRNCVHLGDIDRVEQALALASATNGCHEVEYRVAHPDGSLHWLVSRGQGIYNAEGQLTHLTGIVMDITDHKRDEVMLRLAEEAWQENQQVLDAILSSLPGGVFRCLYQPDRCMKFIYASETYRDLLELNPQEMIAQPQTMFERLHPEDYQAWEAIVEAARTTLASSYLEYRVMLPSGAEKWLARTARFAWADNGDLIVDGIDIDITEQQAAVRERKQAEASLRNILQGTAAATGEEFFPVLVQNLASALGVRHAIVARLVNQQLYTIAFWSDQQLQPNLIFDLAQLSGCQKILEQQSYCCLNQVQQRFPDSEFLRQLQAESYLGVVMQNQTGTSTGSLCIIDDKPLQNTERAEAILRIFAARAAAELERQSATVALQQLNQELETRVEQRTQELIASLHEKEVLLKEVHHRVKNNLQMIQSLLSLQAHSVEEPHSQRVLAESQKRIKAMSLVHEKLYQANNLSRINFAEYVRSLTQALLKSFVPNGSTVQLAIQVAEVELGIDTALPCGLIINELFSNAVKYAFPANCSGKITVQFSLEQFSLDQSSQAAQADFYRLVVADNGIGISEAVDIVTSKSLGLRLVHALTRQLRGTLRLARHSGTQFTITFASPQSSSRESNC
jgi:PAS domain S-box-containing protein